jgi:hypothetical protein
MAAVLACGEGAVLSHRSAAALWGLKPRPRGRWENQPADVTLSGDGGRARRAGIRLHRSSTLLPSQTTIRNAIPVTKPARTLADLRRTISAREWRAALRQAEYLRLPLDGLFAPDGTRSESEAASGRSAAAIRYPARGQREARPLHGRLPVARAAAGRRGRHLRDRRRPGDVRRGPAPGRLAQAGGLGDATRDGSVDDEAPADVAGTVVALLRAPGDCRVPETRNSPTPARLGKRWPPELARRSGGGATRLRRALPRVRRAGRGRAEPRRGTSRG